MKSPNPATDAVQKCRAATEALRTLYATDHMMASLIQRALSTQLTVLSSGGFSTAPIDAIEYPKTASEEI